MVGITSCGAYIPLWRLSRDKLDEGLPGEKAVANFDEDSLTMAVAAAIDCLTGVDRQGIDGLFFTSTTSPYKEKQVSTTIATALDLRRNIVTADFANSLRSATTAVKLAIDSIHAGTLKEVIVVAADCRLGMPGSEFERNCGDGAAAILIGDSDVAVTLEASHSLYEEIIDVWRADEDKFIRSWEDRFVYTEGYLKVVSEAVWSLMEKTGLSAQDFAKVILYAPDARRHLELARSLGFDPKSQVQDPFLATVGNTGTASPLLMLAGALEEVNAGDRLLLASYGNGSDVFVLRATEQINRLKNGNKIKKYLQTKRLVPDYETYLEWRGLLRKERTRRPSTVEPSASALFREQDKNLRLYASKCLNCGAVQYPPQRVCTECRSKDKFETVRLSDKRGKIFTYSLDYISNPLEVPMIVAVVDFDGGGRILCHMTDCDANEIKVGLPVEMALRKLYSAGGIHNYFWKCRPGR